MKQEKKLVPTEAKRMTVKEVAKALGISHDKVTRKVRELFPGIMEDGKTTYLTEAQVTAVKMAITTQLEAMEPTQKCVGKESVKDGTLPKPKTALEKKLIIAQAIQLLQEEIDELRPKADYFDALVDAKGLTNFRNTAKELKVSEKRFIQYLIEKKYLYRDEAGDLRPYADKMQFFEVKDFLGDKSGYVGHQTLITIEGKQRFRKMLEKEKGQNGSITALFDNT